MAAQNYAEELDLVRADLSALRGDVAELVAALGKEARDRVSGVADSARKYSRQGVQIAEHQIAEHPFTSVGVAFGTGLLLGWLLHAR